MSNGSLRRRSTPEPLAIAADEGDGSPKQRGRKGRKPPHVGQRHFRLEAVAPVGMVDGNLVWTWRCDCGAVFDARVSNVREWALGNWASCRDCYAAAGGADVVYFARRAAS